MKLNEQESFYARRYAALQLPTLANSKPNFEAYLIQEQVGGYIPVSSDDFDSEKEFISLVEYGDEGFDTYKSVEGLVAGVLGFDYKDEKSINAYNQQAAEDGVPLFVTYEKAMENNVPGCARSVCYVNDYLEAYGINPDMVCFYRRPDVYNTNAISFTKSGGEGIVEASREHSAAPSRVIPISSLQGDFPVLMNLLYKIGKEELDKETEGYLVEEEFCQTEAEIIERMMQYPQHPLNVAKYNIKFSAPRTIEGLTVDCAKMRFDIRGRVHEMFGSLYPTTDITVKLDFQAGDYEFHKACSYPFKFDATLQALRGEGGQHLNLLDMFNYVMYV